MNCMMRRMTTSRFCYIVVLANMFVNFSTPVGDDDKENVLEHTFSFFSRSTTFTLLVGAEYGTPRTNMRSSPRLNSFHPCSLVSGFVAMTAIRSDGVLILANSIE